MSAPVAGIPPGRFGTDAGEAEHAGAFQKERALLGKQQRKSRQVDLTRIDFGFAEVGVECGRELQTRREVVEHIETGLPAEVVSARPAEMQPPAREEWAEIEPDALRQTVEVCDLTRFGYLKKLRFESSARPAIVLELPIDAASDVESPDTSVCWKAEALERNRKLRDPTL